MSEPVNSRRWAEWWETVVIVPGCVTVRATERGFGISFQVQAKRAGDLCADHGLPPRLVLAEGAELGPSPITEAFDALGLQGALDEMYCR